MAQSATLEGVSTEVRDASARGWRLLPLLPREKTPLVKGWPHLATTALEQLEAWASQWPDCNWGATTGRGSDLLVLDVDGPEGEVALMEHEARGHVLPNTLTATSGRGRHYYFKWPEGHRIRNSTGALGSGLDIRGDGGYIVIPPSIHPRGVPYEYIDSGKPIAIAPQWLVALLTAEAPAITKPVGAIGEGTRNGTLTSQAGAMRRKGMTPSAIEAALLEQNRSCKPPLPEQEVRAIAASVARYEPLKARRPDLLCLADVQPETVDWLWEPYIPRKMLTLLSGDPGVGKTALAMAMAARLTRGVGMDDTRATRLADVQKRWWSPTHGNMLSATSSDLTDISKSRAIRTSNL